MRVAHKLSTVVMVSFTASVLAAAIAAGCVVQASPGSFKFPLKRRTSNLNALARRASGDADVSSASYGVNWDIDVSVGGQNFTMGIDTGSSPFWLLSTRLSSSNITGYSGHPLFDLTKSKTFQNMTGSWNVSYDVGEIYANGDLGTDNVTIGDLTANMPIGLATSTSMDFLGQDSDGIFGMAFSAGNQLGSGLPTFMDAVLPQLDEPVFTFSLPVHGPYSLEFGRVNQSLYNGTLQTVAISNGTRRASLGWHTYVSYDINGKNVSSRLEETVFDTGGIEARANADVVEAYWSLVPGSTPPLQTGQNWHFPCDEALPDLTYNLVGTDGKFVTATVPGRFFNATALSPGSIRGNNCTGGFNANAANTQGTMGWAFWHSYFTVFNMTEPSISIAPYPQEQLDAVSGISGGMATMQPTIVPSALPSSTGGRRTVTLSATSGTNGASATSPAASTSTSSGVAAAVAAGSVPWVGSGLTALLMLLGL